MKLKNAMLALAVSLVAVSFASCGDDTPIYTFEYKAPYEVDPRTDEGEIVKPLKTQVIAHRGYWSKLGYNSQNTTRSFLAAEDLKVYGAEFDVHITSDGVAVASHDATVTIGGASVKVNEITWAYLQQQKLDNGEYVPSLEQFIDAAKGGTIKLIIELKGQPTAELNNKLVDEVVRVVAAKNISARAEYISFSKEIVKRLSEKTPVGTKIQYLVQYNGSVVQTVTDLGATGLDADYRLTDLANEGYIKSFQDANLTVNVWTVNDLPDIKQAVNYNVDFITTDDPKGVIKVIEGIKRGKEVTDLNWDIIKPEYN